VAGLVRRYGPPAEGIFHANTAKESVSSAPPFQKSVPGNSATLR
jgi:hypothetical protein